MYRIPFTLLGFASEEVECSPSVPVNIFNGTHRSSENSLQYTNAAFPGFSRVVFLPRAALVLPSTRDHPSFVKIFSCDVIPGCCTKRRI